MIDRKYILNPYYIMREDKHRVLFTESGGYFKIPSEFAEDAIISMIHPVFAIVLTFFDGRKTYEESISGATEYLKASRDQVEEIVAKLIENKGRSGFDMQGYLSEFPKNVLVEYKAEYEFRDYDPEVFASIETLDYKTQRLFNGPLDLNILVNTICATDCEYCYVDRRVKQNCKIPIERFIELIDEAKAIGVRKVDIAGTEIFLYKHWDVLVKHLLDNGYYPYLSTKLPLAKERIDRLYEVGIRHLQVSMDSLDSETINRLWGVKVEDYMVKMLASLKMVGEKGIELQVNTVVTRTNYSIENLEKMFLELNNIPMLKEVLVNEAGPSTAKSEKEFKAFRISLEQSKKMGEFVEEMNKSKKLNYFIGYSDGAHEDDYINDYSVKKAKFESRASCPAGTRSMCVLNDGQVTICEELYWHKEFLIGNVLDQSIMDIWNSDRAKNFGNLSQNDFTEDSTCSSCSKFYTCKGVDGGVCWSNIVQAYGDENWMFADPACPNAPEPIYEIYSK
ncbi:MAG: radical SAM protein [Crocinitomix sp.]|nr:radical SAM protein [Crocinitomix sp.]